MGEKTKRFIKSVKGTLSNLGNSFEKSMKSIEDVDKKIEENIKNATKGID